MVHTVSRSEYLKNYDQFFEVRWVDFDVFFSFCELYSGTLYIQAIFLNEFQIFRKFTTYTSLNSEFCFLFISTVEIELLPSSNSFNIFKFILQDRRCKNFHVCTVHDYTISKSYTVKKQMYQCHSYVSTYRILIKVNSVRTYSFTNLLNLRFVNFSKK